MKIALLDALPTAERYVTRTRSVMVRLSHTIENVIVREQLPARLYSGFQKLSLFLPERERYRRLAEHCERVVIWGIADVDVPPIPNVTIIPLTPDDPLARTWFVVAVHPAYTSALVAADVSGLPATERLRDFEGAWAFDPGVVSAVERALTEPLKIESPVIEPTRADMVAQLRHAEQTSAQLGRYLENALAREREEAASKEQLSRMIVHDLRGPLSYIGGVSELLLLGAFGEMSESQREQVGELVKQADEMNAMIREVLETYRLEGGHITAEVADVQIGEIVAGVAQTSGLGDRLELALAPDAPTVRADPRLLGRVLVNLLTNARKYGGTGRIRLAALRHGDVISISVTDEGKGIPEALLPHIFKPLKQGANAKPDSGVGLGLAFVRLAVEAMGGSVTAANHPPGGAQFTVELPMG